MTPAEPEGTADLGGGRGERLRLFVACALPPDVVRATAAWQESQFGGREDVRVNRSLHLTLAFLGDTDEALVEPIARLLGDLPFAAAPATFAPPLFLPVRGRKKVVALGLRDASGGLAALQSAAARGLAALGLFPAADRPWLPHVTVARFRRPGHPFSLQNVNVPEFCVVRMVLYSSVLEKSGAVHTPLATFHAS